MRRIHVLGDLNLDLVLAGLATLPSLGEEILAREHSFKAGGSAANVAVVLALCGAPVRLFACVGRDPVGNLVLEYLRGLGLSTATVRRLSGVPTGVTVALSYPQERMYVTSPGTVSRSGLDSFKRGYLRPGAHLHLASFFLQEQLRGRVGELLARAGEAGMSTSLDPGGDPRLRWELGELEPVLPHLDWFLPNESEICALARNGSPEEAILDIGERFRAARANRVSNGHPFGMVIKAGAGGARLWQANATRRFPAVEAPVVDTSCAGDCFDAGFLFALARGDTVEKAVEAGNRLGALGASCLGLPTRKLLRSRGPRAKSRRGSPDT
jgi:sugar/nucleoside kinase (ribokinase family)